MMFTAKNKLQRFTTASYCCLKGVILVSLMSECDGFKKVYWFISPALPNPFKEFQFRFILSFQNKCFLKTHSLLWLNTNPVLALHLKLSNGQLDDVKAKIQKLINN